VRAVNPSDNWVLHSAVQKRPDLFSLAYAGAGIEAAHAARQPVKITVQGNLSNTRELSMAKSRAEMMEIMAKLLAESAEFEDRRPDVPQGDLRALSEEELDILVTEPGR
jgi:hypothetical protein